MMTQHVKLVLLASFGLLIGCGHSGSSGRRGRAVDEAAGAGSAAGPAADGGAGGSAAAGAAAGSAAGSGGAAAGVGGSGSGGTAVGSVAGRTVAYDVYFDNSASMDGYLSGPGTDLKNDVHTFLKDLQTQGIADTIDLGYVNDRICSYRRDASAAEVNAYIRTLNHDSLVRNGCGRKDSYMDVMLQQVIGANPDHVHVLISDYIFSIGRGNSSELLKQQGDNVETVLSSELRRRDFSTIILKFSSEFDGTYYIESRGGGNGSAVVLRGARRPYYLMIFGAARRMRRLVDFFKRSQFGNFNGFRQVCYFFEPGGGGTGTAAHPGAPPAKLIRKNRIGDFEIVEPASNLVIDRAVADSGDLQFSVAVNLDDLKLDEKYLTNPANYQLPANYRIASIRRNDDPTDEALRGFSHVFVIRTSDLKAVQDVYLRLKTVIPAWVYAGSTMDDANPTDSVQQTQTFGFRYLVEGIERGYADKYKSTDQFSLNIQVSEGVAVAGRGSGAEGGSGSADGGSGAEGGDGSGSGGASGLGGSAGSGGGHGGMVWLVVIGGVIIGLVVWIKNKR